MRRRAVASALLLSTALVGCRHDGGRTLPADVGESSVPPARCAQAPDTCHRRWPPAAARAADHPSPRNSDGTLKCLPAGPPSEPGRTVLFGFDDFGPPSMQLGILGDAWWSWEAGGSFEPGDEFDIRVVVFQGLSAKDVEAKYPTVRGKSDYRIVTRESALRYLDREIAELGHAPTGPDEYDFGPLKRMLEQTRSTIVACLAR